MIKMIFDVVENIKSEICGNAFTVTNPKNTYEYISVIDIAILGEIFDKYLGKESEERNV